MIYKKIFLKEICDKCANSEAFLEIYSLADKHEAPIDRKRPGMLVIPGGGYEFVSLREGEPFALRYLSEGFTTFVITYSINKKYPTPHLETAVAMNYINTHADELNIYPNSTSVVGFSAGGHLAASYSYLYPELAQMIGAKEENLRPYTTNLSYPVITFNDATHEGTMRVITGMDKDLIQKLSVEKHVTKDYPPTFIWTTKDDTCVPPVNTYHMVRALEMAGVEFVAKYYELGEHGFSLANRSVTADAWKLTAGKDVHNWVDEDVQFVYKQLDKKFPL